MHTLFICIPCRYLTPPITCCINEACSAHGLGDSLTSHHSSTKVTIYTLSGPEIGVKQALKCGKCSYIYNYSTYGRKTSVGEKLYVHPRELVEVSDMTYCGRELYELFCSLRLVHSYPWNVVILVCVPNLYV